MGVISSFLGNSLHISETHKNVVPVLILSDYYDYYGIFYVYKITNQTQWSKIVTYRRLRFLGHIARVEEKAPAKVALYEATRP